MGATDRLGGAQLDWGIEPGHVLLAATAAAGLLTGTVLLSRRRSDKPPSFVAAPERVTLAAATDFRSENIARGSANSAPWAEAIRQLEAKRNSHVVGFIHYLSRSDGRHQGIGGWHLQDFLWSLKQAPVDVPLDIILHSPGGDPSSIQQIARAIKAHKGPTTVFVPYYAYGFSPLIALAADRVVMGAQAAFSFPHARDVELTKLVRHKGVRHVEDETLIDLHYARNLWRELKAFANEVTKPAARGFAAYLFDPQRVITTPVGPAEAGRLGLAVSTDMPAEVSDVIEACQCYPNDTFEAKTSNQVETERVENSAYSQTDSGYGWCEPSCHIGVAPLMRAMQERRGTHVVCIVHGPAMDSSRVDMATAKDVLRALSMVPADAPLDVVLHTPGGVSFHGQQIARALKAHKGRKTVFVPYFAWSAGTLIALAADEIVMSEHAALGPIDTQYDGVPASAWISVAKQKPRKKLEDQTLLYAQTCERLIADDHAKAVELMRGVYPPRLAARIVRTLNEGTLTHGYPITFQGARALGLKVSNAMPPEAEQIVHAFRDPNAGYRSVIFCAG